MADCDEGAAGCVVGVADGAGGALDLTDLGLGARGFGGDGPPESCGLRASEEGGGWAERSVVGVLAGGERSVWSPEVLLSCTMVSS